MGVCSYMHPDIWGSNLLFPGDGTEALLIDFDLMDLVDKDYSEDYNDLCECHPDAKSSEQRKKIHIMLLACNLPL